MRLMSVNVECFLHGERSLISKLNPFNRKRRKIIRQYLNIEELKRIKNEVKPDLMALNQIDFVGVGGVLQIEAINNNLIENRIHLNPYVSYNDGGEYSTALFGGYISKTINLTPDTYCIETKLGDVSVISINLSKRNRTRKRQLDSLREMININIHKKYIIIGQYNLKRENELRSLIHSCRLFNLPLPPTYPKNKPKKKVFRVLHNSDIKVFDPRIINSDLSNHLPIVFDIAF